MGISAYTTEDELTSAIELADKICMEINSRLKKELQA